MSSTQGIGEGMDVYGADNQLLGRVDQVQEAGFLVDGQYIPSNAVGQVERNRVVLTDSGAWFKPQGAERGDQSEEELGSLASDASGLDVKLSTTPKQ